MNFSVLNEFLLAIILGIIQGVTEFLPISSTAHIYLVSNLIANFRDVGLQSSNILQFGTLIAIATYFWGDLKVFFVRIKQLVESGEERLIFKQNLTVWWNYPERDSQSPKYTLEQIQSYTQNPNWQTDILLAQVAVGTLPILVLAPFLYNFVAEIRDFASIASFLILGALLLYFSQKVNTQALKLSKSAVMLKGEVLLIGIFQVLAIFPGVSRSGATLAGAFLVGRDRKQSVRFSFLLALPILFIAGISDIIGLLSSWETLHLLPEGRYWGESSVNLSLLASFVSLLIAGLVGYLSLKWLIRFLNKHPLDYFIWYRIGLGILILTLVGLSII